MHILKIFLSAAIILAGVSIIIGSETEDALQRGQLSLKNNETEKAIAAFTEVIQREPKNEKAFLLRARAHGGAGQTDSAISDYGRVLEIDAENQEAHAERGDLYFKKGEMDKAMADYAKLRTTKGEAMTTKSLQEHAAEQLVASQATAVELFLEAERLAGSGKTEKAIQLYNRILDLPLPAERAAVVLRNRGSAHYGLGNIEQARADFDLALQYNPADASIYLARGLLLTRQNDTRGAVRDFNEALRFDPKMFQALFGRAEAYWLEKDAKAAMEDLAKVIELDKKFAPAYALRGAIFLKHGYLNQALAEVNKAIQRDRKFAPAYLTRAEVFGRKRAYARKLADLETAVGLAESPVEALNNLAWLRATCPSSRIRNGKKAVEAAMRACELTSWQNGSCVDTLAAAYAENDEFEKAANFQLYALSLPGFPPDARKAAEDRATLYKSGRPYREMIPELPPDSPLPSPTETPPKWFGSISPTAPEGNS